MDTIAPGRYVVAVSGGVDSMVLLDVLRRQNKHTLVVAHADHAQRPDSPLDVTLVQAYCKKYQLAFVTKKLNLPVPASEAAARHARWEFLQYCLKKYQADAIITAHHQDDLIETVLIALLRGTGWRGLAPFVASQNIVRPLLNLTKNDLIGYARRHNIAWREDATNADQRYLRNYVRHALIPLLDQKSDDWRTIFLQQIRKQQKLRHEIIAACDAWLASRASVKASELQLPRYDLTMLPQNIAYELLQHALWRHTGHTVLRSQAEAAVLFTKVAKPAKLMQLGETWQLRAESANVIVEPRPTVVSLKKH